MVSADPILKPIFHEPNTRLMEAVYQLLVRELQLEALKLRRKLEEKKRRIILLQQMAELERLNEIANEQDSDNYPDDFETQEPDHQAECIEFETSPSQEGQLDGLANGEKPQSEALSQTLIEF